MILKTLGIDASSIRAGGGLTHLSEMLRVSTPSQYGFDRVLIWGCQSTLDKIEDLPWLIKINDPMLEKSLIMRALWNKFRLKHLAEAAGCDLLFVPGGSDASEFHPMVAMSQNMLPFDWREMRRPGLSPKSLKHFLLRHTQTKTFRRAEGVIFLTSYARDMVLRVTGPLRGRLTTVPHGVEERFLSLPRKQRTPPEFTKTAPLRILYVSIISEYKHQWQVIEGVSSLRESGIHVTLDLVGPPGNGMARLHSAIERFDPHGEFVSYLGPVPYAQMHEHYLKADIGVFASSCEAFGQVLTETMGAGLPIACSDRLPLPELLGDAGEYFDPEDPKSIAAAIGRLIESPQKRASMAQAAHDRARSLSWRRCAEETFEFLSNVGPDKG